MSEFWSVVVLVGLAGWISSALLFLFKAFPGRGQFLARPAMIWGGAFLVAYLVWIVGMLSA